jgi:hypothetical protein
MNNGTGCRCSKVILKLFLEQYKRKKKYYNEDTMT